MQGKRDRFGKRRIEDRGKGIESMPIEDFAKRMVCAFIPR
jgi:hypothetical protein